MRRNVAKSVSSPGLTREERSFGGWIASTALYEGERKGNGEGEGKGKGRGKRKWGRRDEKREICFQ